MKESSYALQRPGIFSRLLSSRLPRVNLVQINDILRTAANLVFFTPLKVRDFKAKYPDETIVVAGVAKGQRLEKAAELNYDEDWMLARRGVLILSDKRLILNSWEIMTADITDAEIIKTRTLYGDTALLRVRTRKNEFFQFGLPFDVKWIANKKGLHARVSSGEMKYAKYSIYARVGFLCYLFYCLLKYSSVI